MMDKNTMGMAYQNFYNCMSKCYGLTRNIDDAFGNPDINIKNIEKIYSFLKRHDAEDIEHLRGSLNTLREKLGMEVIENDGE